MQSYSIVYAVILQTCNFWIWVAHNSNKSKEDDEGEHKEGNMGLGVVVRVAILEDFDQGQPPNNKHECSVCTKEWVSLHSILIIIAICYSYQTGSSYWLGRRDRWHSCTPQQSVENLPQNGLFN